MERRDLELLRGGIDLHVHQGPALFERHHFVDVVRNARDLGLRAVVLKNHHICTTDRAEAARSLLPGIDVFGSIVLNYSNGGVNPFAVDYALRLGAKKVWMPTIDTEMQRRHFGQIGGYGAKQSRELPEFYERAKPIRISDEHGTMTSGLDDVLGLIKEFNAILAVGHVTQDETADLVEAASQKGIKKIVVDHPYLPFTDLDIQRQRDLVEAGAIMNYSFSQLTPKWFSISVPKMVEHIGILGTDNIVLTSDLGQLHNPLPAEGLRNFVQILLEEGVPEDDVDKMLSRNPAKLLYDGG